MGRRAKRIEVFDADRFYNENRELCEKYFKKDTKNLIIEDIDCPKEQLLDNRVGIPSRNYDYDGLTVLHQLVSRIIKQEKLRTNTKEEPVDTKVVSQE